MTDIREFKDRMDKLNYTEEELAIFHGEEAPSGKEYNKLLRKVMRLEDTEHILRLLKYVS